MSGDIQQQQHDGEASPPEGRAFALPLTGTPAQVEWAERIRRQVNGDFDRVAAAFRLFNGQWTIVSAPAAPQGGGTIDVEARAALAILFTRLSQAGIFPGS